MPTAATKQRTYVIDALKAIASQLIVWHHLAIYGPMADTVYPQAPGLLDWLEVHARIAVQVFLAIGGYLAARSLVPLFEREPVSLPRLLWKRYLRLAPPYLVAVVAAILAATFARLWLFDPSTPNEPSVSQVLAHIFLLQDVAGEEALSAGAWYVAIDFQLYAMVALLLWGSRRLASTFYRRAAVGVCAAVAAASLFWWNRNSGLDVWAPYFFGSYGLGFLAQRISVSKRPRLYTTLLALLVASALAVQWRDRILLAGITAVLLACGSRVQPSWIRGGLIAFLARISYSLFVIHYPVCLTVNTVVFHFWPGDRVANGLGMFAAWLLSVGAGALLHRFAEKNATRVPGRPVPEWANAAHRLHAPPATTAR